MTADAVGGVWRYAIDLSRELGESGILVTLAVMGPSPDECQRREAARAGVSLVDQPFALEWMNDPWESVAQAADWLLSLERVLRPDLVHLNGYVHAALGWRAPVIVVAHSCVRSWWRAVKQEPAPPDYTRYTERVLAGLRSARAVVAPSAAMVADLAREYGSLDPPAVVIRNGTRPRDVASGAAKAPIVLTAGRVWDAAKNIDAVCAAAARVSWPVYVAGECASPDGRARPCPNVEVLGRLDPDVMQVWFDRASIFVLPALYEPFGLSILEAAASGCALVVGDIPSLREQWYEAAEFVEPGDDRALAGMVQSLIDDPGRRRELASKARARASWFTTGRTAGEYLQLYESLTA
jgi:glycosyltransferase involved in cell wall biosynthesis